MTVVHRILQLTITGVMALALSSNAMASDKTTNTLLGAGIGAAAGALLSEGDPLLTLGGAAAGGVLGHVLTDDRKHRGHQWRGDHRKSYKQGNSKYRHAGYHRGHHKKRHPHRRH